MKIAVCSDLHLEFGDLDLQNTEGADVLILGGDIFIASELIDHDSNIENFASKRGMQYVQFINRCCERFKHVLMVMGNHEHYHGDFAKSANIIRGTFGDLPNFHLLDKEWRIINGVLFFGGSLWTDMNREDPVTMVQIQGCMNDYRQIKNTGPLAGGKFLPQDSVEDHYAFRRALDEVLELHPQLPVVVVGHHAPSKASTHPRYKTETMMNGAYSSNLNEFILDRRQIKLWTHGHTHEDFDYRIGVCRIVCNPRGYDGYENKADTFTLKYVDLNPEVTIEYEDDGYHD